MISPAFLRHSAVAFVCLLCAGCARPRQPGRLSIAAAADLQFALAEARPPVSQPHPQTELSVVYGSSGNFYAQIRNGAPFDVFLSADVEYPRQAGADGAGPRGLALRLRRRPHRGVGAGAGSPLDPATALRDPSVRRLAIANPQHAPYGRAARGRAAVAGRL